ncbi:MAG: primosomal protein N' [Mariniblastus sp.]|nr:primosomal protein N' [Mariniblastus sp.]
MTKQNQLFDTTPEPWRLDDQDDWLAARVVFSQAPYGPYDYQVPSNLEQQVRAGVRLTVPLGRGNRARQAYCIDVIGPFHPLASTVNPQRLKPLTSVLDEQPILDESLLELAKWISDYYVCPLGNVIETVVPTGIREGSGTREMLFLALADGLAEQLADLKLSPKQRAILETLAAGGSDWTPRELADTVGCTQGPITALRKKGWITSSSRRVRQLSHEIPKEKKEQDLDLNKDQQQALDSIEAVIEQSEYRSFLMHGITGSGKTEVYIRAIQKIVEYGRQAIVLVPEISLTPQTRQRFRARFERVAVLHSHLTAAQRAWHWNEIANGNVQVIIGARSAIFAPTPNLGLIVLDEEHDGSFKQDKAPRYHAREVAVWRAKRAKIPMILGSATPALESWNRASTGEFDLLSLPRRVLDLPLPDVATIDLRVDFGNRKSRGAISQKLRQEIRSSLNQGGQVILLLNRRGFATRIQCPACGHVEYCPDCSIPMTHHRDGSKAVCHYCDYQISEPQFCTECGYAAIRLAGMGTQKLEQEVQAIFPDVPCMRMDTDTMRKPGSHELALSEFREGKIKILLGTQMIAKGLDFPNVTLVGVINADTALHFPDFRASERTFGLVTQVAGRSGRGPKGGRVLVQTFSPDNPAIMAATKHDYLGFAAGEIPNREAFGYPPFGLLARVVIRSESQERAKQMGEHITAAIQQAADELQTEIVVLGPAPAPVEKLRGKHRFHILIRSAIDSPLQPVIRRASAMVQAADEVQWIVDVDPIDML